MGLVLLRLRSEVRRQWRAVVALALVVGLGGGVALAAFAGARRTDTAVPRFLAYYRADDGGFLYGNVFSPPVATGKLAYSLALPPIEQEVVDLPQVEAWFRAPYLFLTDNRNGGQASINPVGAADAALFRAVDRPNLLAGRLPDPARPFDAAVNELAATRHHLHPGSTVRLYAYSYDQVAHGDLTAGTAPRQRAKGPSFTVRVTAIVRFPTDVNAVIPLAAKQDVSYEGQQDVYLTPAFLLRLAAGLGIPVQRLPSLNLVGVRLRHGPADWQAFASAASAIGHGTITPSPGDVNGARTAAASAQRGAHLAVIALVLLGACAALVTVVLVGQAMARQSRAHAADYATMRALGAAPRQVIGVVAMRAAVTAVGGAAVAFVVAVLASPLTPIGLARQAEIHPGYELNVAVLVLGCAALVALVTASSLRTAWRVARAAPTDERTAEQPSRLAGAVLRAPLPAPAAMGVRFGLGRGPGPGAPLAPALTSAVLAVTAFVSAVTFGRSLDHLVATPRQQGWNWDVIVGNPNDQTDREAQAGALLARNPLVGGYSAMAIIAGANQGTAVIDGQTVDAVLAIDPMKGEVYPPLLDGHAPESGDEIVLGSQTMRRLHKHLGDSVHIPTPEGKQLTLRVVGRMISPSVGDLFTNGVGDGAWVYGPAVRQDAAQSPPQANGPPPTAFVLFAVRYAAGAPRAAAYASLRRDFGATVLGPLPGQDAVNLKSVDRLPLLLAALVVLIGIVTVGNMLLSSVRRRRRDLAVLKIMGFERGQVVATVVWQAAAIALISGGVGVALGVAAGRSLWHVVATNLYSVSPALVPTLPVACVVPAALAAAVLAAVLPGWSAGRTRPAVVLRRE